MFDRLVKSVDFPWRDIMLLGLIHHHFEALFNHRALVHPNNLRLIDIAELFKRRPKFRKFVEKNLFIVMSHMPNCNTFKCNHLIIMWGYNLTVIIPINIKSGTWSKPSDEEVQLRMSEIIFSSIIGRHLNETIKSSNNRLVTLTSSW